MTVTINEIWMVIDYFMDRVPKMVVRSYRLGSSDPIIYDDCTAEHLFIN